MINIKHNDNYQIISSDLIQCSGYECKSFFLKYRLFDGNWSGNIETSIIMRSKSIGALLYDPILKKVVLIKQFRSGAIDIFKDPWLLEIVAGKNDLNLTPTQAVIQEIKEEVGITNIGKLIHIYDFLSNPCITNELMQLFCVLINIKNINCNKSFGNKNEGEDIKVYIFSLNEIIKMINSGVISNSLTIIALQWLILNEKDINY
jgi:ADP-ribose pyrophosphatase